MKFGRYIYSIYDLYVQTTTVMIITIKCNAFLLLWLELQLSFLQCMELHRTKKWLVMKFFFPWNSEVGRKSQKMCQFYALFIYVYHNHNLLFIFPTRARWHRHTHSNGFSIIAEKKATDDRIARCHGARCTAWKRKIISLCIWKLVIFANDHHWNSMLAGHFEY